MTTAPVRMDPRIRERRVEVQRARGRRRLRRLVIAAGAAAVVAVGYLALRSPFLDVDRIEVAGAEHTGADAIRAASGVHGGDALAFVDTGAVEARLERLPWVADATATRVFPGTVRVTVREHAPVAYVRDEGAIVVLAADGRVLGRVAELPAGLVEVRGLRRVPADAQIVTPSEPAAVVARLPEALRTRVRVVEAAGGGVQLQLDGGGVVRLGSSDDLDAKAAAAIAVLDEPDTTPFAYLDVAVPQSPVLRR